MEHLSGVDDHGLAGHCVAAAHGDHHVGAIALVGGLLQQRGDSGAGHPLRALVVARARALQVAGGDAVDQRLRRQRHRHAVGEMDEAGFGDGVGDG